MKKLLIIILSVVVISSCKKEPGEGGFATIKGKIFVKNFDAFFSIKTSEYYLPSETVHIIYGDGTEVGNTVKTSYDGSFSFNYLRKGKYKVYVLGKDSTSTPKGNPIAVTREVYITEKRQNTDIGDIVIVK